VCVWECVWVCGCVDVCVCVGVWVWVCVGVGVWGGGSNGQVTTVAFADESVKIVKPIISPPKHITSPRR